MKIDDLYAAKKRIQPYLAQTPLLLSSLLTKTLNQNIWLKLETQQLTGSFKTRPAFNNILMHLAKARAQGVIASSSGNFAQGVAYAARELNIKSMIVMTENTSLYKIERTKQLGAEVVLCGNSYEARHQTTDQLAKETGRLLLHAYDADETIAGDGTIGLEVSDALGETLNHEMAVLVPVSGGGLIAGIALALKTLHPHCRMIGVQPEKNGSLAAALQSGKCVPIGPVQTIADALVASMTGEKPFALIQKYVDDVVLVTEEEIELATQFLIEQHKLVVEPGGAVTIAALLAKKVLTKNCVCIISGGNIHLWAPLIIN